jgi:hypothetical protein
MSEKINQLGLILMSYWLYIYIFIKNNIARHDDARANTTRLRFFINKLGNPIIHLNQDQF